MSQSVENLERKRLLEVRRDYEKQGYKVILEPKEEELPEFLAGFRPDLLAYNDKESVVVEVRSKTTLVGAEDLTSLANVVETVTGWRLDLVVTKAEPQPEELSQADIQNRIEQVSKLINAAQEEAAFLLGWSALEATLRSIARRESIVLEKTDPAYVIKKLISLGVIDRDDYPLFRTGLTIRNQVIHGFRAVELSRELTSKLLDKTRELLQAEAY